jgi:NADH-quinone oxidoreductase subunit F
VIATKDKKLSSPADLEDLRTKVEKKRSAIEKSVHVCIGTGCAAKGSRKLYELFLQAVKETGRKVKVESKCVGCHGFCERGPIVEVQPGNILYQRVEEPDVEEIFRETVIGDRVVERLVYQDPASEARKVTVDEIPFYKAQKRVVLRDNGQIDPTNVEDYILTGGYSALVKALTTMEPDEIVEEVEKSDLRGRGGGGFPTGRKWRTCRDAEGDHKYVICNGDEGDPGAFMDRSIMEGNPHLVLEGLIIGAYAIGASKGFIYVRNEYPLAVEHHLYAVNRLRSLPRSRAEQANHAPNMCTP